MIYTFVAMGADDNFKTKTRLSRMKMFTDDIVYVSHFCRGSSCYCSSCSLLSVMNIHAYLTVCCIVAEDA